jgi:hypothetical protein
MWKITTHGVTLEDVLTMAAMNRASALIAPDKSEETTTPSTETPREIVMAKVIEFYTPKNFRKPFRTAAQPQPGKIIEFCSQTKRSD